VLQRPSVVARAAWSSLAADVTQDGQTTTRTNVADCREAASDASKNSVAPNASCRQCGTSVLGATRECEAAQDRAAKRDGTHNGHHVSGNSRCCRSEIPARPRDHDADDARIGSEDAPGQEALRAAQKTPETGIWMPFKSVMGYRQCMLEDSKGQRRVKLGARVGT